MTTDPTSADAADARPEPISVRELVGRNLRRLRLADGIDHEQIAKVARGHGLDWTGTWVAGIERGQKTLSAEHLVSLPFVLTDTVGHRVSLADLLQGDEPVLLGRADAGAVSPTYLREVLTATPYRRDFATPLADAPAGDSPSQRAAEKMREIGRAGLGDVDVRALSRAEAGAGDLEEKLARRLGVPSIVVIAAAAALWGRSATEERDARLDPDPFGEPAMDAPKPTSVVRKLTTEVTARLAEAEDAVRDSAGPVESGEHS